MKFSGIHFIAFLTATSACDLTDRARRTQVGGDPCFRDSDCDDCTAPVCIKSLSSGFTSQGQGFCGAASPSSTPAPIQLAPGPGVGCCPLPKRNVPTDCEVELLIDLLDIAIATDHKLAAQWLRLSFHDAGTFNQATNKGGANGCLMNKAEFRAQPENGFLDLPIESLEAVKANWEVHPDTCLDVSSADMIQFAGFFAAKRQESPVGVDTALKRNALKAFEWGRLDEPFCNVDWVDNLPGFRLDAPEGNIPLRCLSAGSEIKRKMMERNGFTAEESAALIGAHTIGLTRNSFDPEMAAPWVDNGADDFSNDGPTFDNAFHSFLSTGITATTAKQLATNAKPFNEIFPDWYHDSVGEKNYLDTDVVLAFPSEDLSVHPNFHVFTDAFAKNNQLFLNKFFLALNKMSKLGVNELLSSSTRCTTCDGDGILTTGELGLLVSDLGTAMALAEEELRLKQQSSGLLDARKKDEIPVKSEDILNADASLKEIKEVLQGAKTDAQKQTALEKLSKP